MEKPKPPIEPNFKDYSTPKEPNGKNHLGESIYQKLDYIEAYKQFQKDLEKYNTDIQVYEQLKLVKLIRNSTDKYCLKTFKITRK